MQLIYSTGDIAKLCHVSMRTVGQWCDKGRLPHYRIPGSRDRRIRRDDLITFLDAHGMPHDLSKETT